MGISANDSHHVVIRRNHILPGMYGICFNGNQTGKVSNFWVTDNLIEGPCKWPRTRGIENPGGMYLTGRGHVVAWNRVHHFADGIDTYGSKVCAAINTILRQGVPWLVWSQGPVYNCVSRNNLFVGTKGDWAMEFTCEMVGCDFDYDGFAGMVARGRSPNGRPGRGSCRSGWKGRGGR